ncbi:MAG TPA: sensor domain-containing diguanylate cyclase, partial [Clostridiales bacterium]|nr:sensor domain-containing diguanylate cyclase [Clostridiales bacterium]
MTESKIKKYKMVVWLPILVLFIGIGLLSPAVHLTHYEHKDHLKTNASLNAETYSERMKSELSKGVAVTNALEQILISEKGEVNDFDTVAKNLITEYIQSIQLAPDGVVTQCYPPSTARDSGVDVFRDPQSATISEYARDHDKITVQGPFTLSQGGEGIVIRNPVYLAKEDDTPESQEFWGFTVVIIKVPKIFEDSIEALDSFGYDYRLTKESSIDERDSKTVFSSEAELTTPATKSFTLGCSTWTLEVMPHGGWNAGDKTMVVFLTGALIILLFAALTLFTLILAERHNKYKQLATVDVLTGLLNRAGFENAFAKYLSSHEGEPCVE